MCLFSFEETFIFHATYFPYTGINVTTALSNPQKKFIKVSCESSTCVIETYHTSLVSRPFLATVFAGLPYTPFLHTASDQKLELGKTWEGGYHTQVIKLLIMCS